MRVKKHGRLEVSALRAPDSKDLGLPVVGGRGSDVK